MKVTNKALLLGITAFVLFTAAQAGASGPYVYVAGNYGVIERFDSEGNGSVFAEYSGYSYMRSLAFDDTGNLYAAAIMANTILRYDANGSGTVFTTTLARPNSLDFDSSGNLYASSAQTKTIMKFDANGNGTLFCSNVVPIPTAIAIDSSDNVYVVDYGGDIVKLDHSGNASLFATNAYCPRGMAFDSLDNLYVSRTGAALPLAILKFDSNGNVSTLAEWEPGADPYVSPCGLAFDDSDNLYVASPDGMAMITRVYSIDVNGNQSMFVSDAYPEGYAIAVQVPEPATWVMLVAGIGALCGVRCLRKRRATKEACPPYNSRSN